jgi:hypothetical protein
MNPYKAGELVTDFRAYWSDDEEIETSKLVFDYIGREFEVSAKVV